VQSDREQRERMQNSPLCDETIEQQGGCDSSMQLIRD
jgi:hypothetical protein